MIWSIRKNVIIIIIAVLETFSIQWCYMWLPHWQEYSSGGKHWTLWIFRHENGQSERILAQNISFQHLHIIQACKNPDWLDPTKCVCDWGAFSGKSSVWNSNLSQFQAHNTWFGRGQRTLRPADCVGMLNNLRVRCSHPGLDLCTVSLLQVIFWLLINKGGYPPLKLHILGN